MKTLKEQLEQAFQALNMEFKAENNAAEKQLLRDTFGVDIDDDFDLDLKETNHIFRYDVQIKEKNIPFPMNFRFVVDEDNCEINAFVHVDVAIAKSPLSVMKFINDWHKNTKIPKLAFNVAKQSIIAEWFWFLQDMQLNVEFFKNMLQHIQITTTQCFSLAVKKGIFKKYKDKNTKKTKDQPRPPDDERLVYKDDVKTKKKKNTEDMQEFQDALKDLEFEPTKRKHRRRHPPFSEFDFDEFRRFKRQHRTIE